ncbi:hypothetical protein V3C99_018006 [Haemonchus contortus]|uniref:BZIP domain-containing protein n=1 Tax=Haemonchus contortus TaxID=6289 RepID=A0A7I5EE50_HAECO
MVDSSVVSAEAERAGGNMQVAGGVSSVRDMLADDVEMVPEERHKFEECEQVKRQLDEKEKPDALRKLGKKGSRDAVPGRSDDKVGSRLEALRKLKRELKAYASFKLACCRNVCIIAQREHAGAGYQCVRSIELYASAAIRQ